MAVGPTVVVTIRWPGGLELGVRQLAAVLDIAAIEAQSHFGG